MADPDPATWVTASRDRLEQDILRLALTEASVASGVHGDLRKALAVLDAVLALHAPEPAGVPDRPNLRVCDRCNQAWPCYEYELITSKLLSKEGSQDA